MEVICTKVEVENLLASWLQRLDTSSLLLPIGIRWRTTGGEAIEWETVVIDYGEVGTAPSLPPPERSGDV